MFKPKKEIIMKFKIKNLKFKLKIPNKNYK